MFVTGGERINRGCQCARYFSHERPVSRFPSEFDDLRSTCGLVSGGADSILQWDQDEIERHSQDDDERHSFVLLPGLDASTIVSFFVLLPVFLFRSRAESLHSWARVTE